jgi:hypothetical protein
VHLLRLLQQTKQKERQTPSREERRCKTTLPPSSKANDEGVGRATRGGSRACGVHSEAAAAPVVSGPPRRRSRGGWSSGARNSARRLLCCWLREMVVKVRIQPEMKGQARIQPETEALRSATRIWPETGGEGAEEHVADGLLGTVVAADELVVLEVLRELLVPDQLRSRPLLSCIRLRRARTHHCRRCRLLLPPTRRGC